MFEGDSSTVSVVECAYTEAFIVRGWATYVRTHMSCWTIVEHIYVRTYVL